MENRGNVVQLWIHSLHFCGRHPIGHETIERVDEVSRREKSDVRSNINHRSAHLKAMNTRMVTSGVGTIVRRAAFSYSAVCTK